MSPGQGTGGQGARGQGAAERGNGQPARERSESGKASPAGERGASGRPVENGQTGNAARGSGGAGQRSGGRNVRVSSEQQTRITTSIRSSIRSEHIESIPHVDFGVRIGAVVPRHYHYYPLPPSIYEIVPEYRGYDYILVEDQILIIDPDTGEIVLILS